jgi:hypothetical protein
MMGTKSRTFASLCNRSLENLVPAGHFYRHLEAKLDLGFVRELVRSTYKESGCCRTWYWRHDVRPLCLWPWYLSDDLGEAIEPLLPRERPKPKGGRPRIPADPATAPGLMLTFDDHESAIMNQPSVILPPGENAV